MVSSGVPTSTTRPSDFKAKRLAGEGTVGEATPSSDPAERWIIAIFEKGELSGCQEGGRAGVRLSCLVEGEKDAPTTAIWPHLFCHSTGLARGDLSRPGLSNTASLVRVRIIGMGQSGLPLSGTYSAFCRHEKLWTVSSSKTADVEVMRRRDRIPFSLFRVLVVLRSEAFASARP